jgi:ferredoxin-NADP reductase
MLLRIKGYPDELPPRILVHMCLALMVAPLLIAKMVVARKQKAARGLLSALGVSLFVVSFLLVALNVFSHFLSKAATAKVATPISAVFIAVSVGGLASLFLFPHRARKPDSDDHGPGLTKEPASDPHTTTMKLVRIQPQTGDAKTLRFLVQPGKRFSARPGQFLTFDWTIAGKQICRSYSICSSPMQDGYIEITSKRVANGRVSQFLNEDAVVGLEVKAHGPFGQFCFDERKHKRIVLLAGGSGITPMIAMLRYIDDLCIPTDATLIYCVRFQKDVLFAAEIEDLQERLQSLRYVLVLSQPETGWNGPRGCLTKELLNDTIERPGEAFFFLCGPAPFMEHVQVLLEAMGVPPAQILRESFGAAPTTSAVFRCKLESG